MSWIRLTIKSELEEVVLIGQSLGAVCESFGCKEDILHRIQIAVVEAVTNVIRHAYKSASGHEVNVTVNYNSSRLDVDVEDNGSAMDAEHVELLQHGSSAFDFDPSDLDKVPEGGLGLEIIHRSSDRVEYFRSESSNRLRMTMYTDK